MVRSLVTWYFLFRLGIRFKGAKPQFEFGDKNNMKPGLPVESECFPIVAKVGMFKRVLEQSELRNFQSWILNEGRGE